MTGSLWKSLAGLIVLLALGFAGWTWWSARQSTAAFYLLTPSEVAQYAALPAPSEQPEMPNRGVRLTQTDGPDIRFSSPGSDTLASPVDFDVSLKARNGVAVDMGSIRIEYKMGPAWVNVTGRIMKQASIKGTRLFARSADLPKGRHTMRLSVSDDQLRKTQAVVTFTVR